MEYVKRKNNASDKARHIIRNHGGIIRTATAIQSGIHPRTLYHLRDEGLVEQLSRGVFRLSDQKSISNLDLIIVATRIPKAVICLTSALFFHEMTTQIPHSVSIAIPKGSNTPRIEYPPISVHRFSKKAQQTGVIVHQIDNVSVKIFNPEKTLADCFKFRNKIGMDIVLEAIKFYKARKDARPAEILRYAKVCRVEKQIRPYLESII